MTGFAPRHLRNPRRAYDQNGIEYPPMTVANARENRAIGIEATCRCGHEAIVPLERLPDETPVPDAGLLMRCSACGQKGVVTRPAWGDPFEGRR